MDLLKLSAFDEDDLKVISAHMQDAVLRVGDIRYLPGERRLALVANRFDWESGLRGGEGPAFQRRRAGLHFDHVFSARSQNIRQGADDAVLSLLSIAFAPGEAPSGEITLTFSGGGTLWLDVECIEAHMADLGPVWETGRKPEHDLTDRD
ncbi:DUF2948 family protein [Kaustia mangrovi]|uniref:DUF2948 family protein n=1 Tax=Kaustia mangrovi TaxID=2593653 RepID=A0A7S8HBJ0_9HYPH|nr:DUF2948 family protein [Kaustia mangrovi]QPC42541.1 DUF2948 family protein [Kaustia mangrovi]